MKPKRQRQGNLTTWAVPLMHASSALVVGMALPRLETHFWPDLISTMSAAAAMSICSAIASGMIALTGIVFSLAFVMVQFSAIAYSPRLVMWVARDRVMSHALGVFSATFLYSLTLLAWVDRGDSGKVPLISGWLVFGLLIASMGMFIALIERIGLLQVNRMLIFTGNQGRQAIEELYPREEVGASTTPSQSHQSLPSVQTLTHIGAPQAVQAIDAPALLDLAIRFDAVIELQALDQIEDLLLRLGRRQLNIHTLRDATGMVRVVVPAPTWEDFLLLAFDEIRAYGAESVQVMRRMKALIRNLLGMLPPDRHPALLHWEARLKGSIARSFKDIEERRDASVPDRQGLGIGQEIQAAPKSTLSPPTHFSDSGSAINPSTI